jgi:hypothetical protein
MFRAPKPRGQALLEFGLAAIAMLMILFVIIEGALVLHSYLAIQHAAREAARWAVTYQPPFRYTLEQADRLKRGELPEDETPGFGSETEAQWHMRRIGYIKERALQQAVGVSYTISKTDEIGYLGTLSRTVGFLGVRVGRTVIESDDTRRDCGDYLDAEGICWDQQGFPDQPVLVRVDYRWRPIDPLLSGAWPNGVPLRGQAEMVNEGTQWSRLAPTREVPPTPTGYQPTPTNTPVGTPTTTPTPTVTPTFTPTPTPTPSEPYLVLSPKKKVWPEYLMPTGLVELYNHLPDGQYDISWTDNCGKKTDLGIPVYTFFGSASANMPLPGQVGPDFQYVCRPVELGQVYTGTLSTSLASLDVAVLVPDRTPDLVVERIVVPEPIVGGETITIGVVISNTGLGVVSDTFDVDIYVNPSREPVLKGQPGQGTSGGSSPKQWYTEVVSPGMRATLNYVIAVPSTGRLNIWAQVDTSDIVSELDEDNNILGPLEFSLPCSDQSDDFDRGYLDPKWTLSPVGARAGSGNAQVLEDFVRIEGTGAGVWSADDGGSWLLHQGAYSGNYAMTVRVLDYPRGGKAGLTVRESLATGERYVAIAVIEDGGGPYLQSIVRTQDSALPTGPCGNSPIPSYLFDGSEANGEGVWLRIVRENQTLRMYSSLDGKSWHTEECKQHEFSEPALDDLTLPGIWLAPHDEASARHADYDDFELCSLGSAEPPPVRPKPPLLKECGNVLLNSDFEPAGSLLPWVVGQEPAAVVSDARYSSDRDGRLVEGYSMLLKADDDCGGPCHPWASQQFVVPAFVSTTEAVTIEMVASLYYLVPPQRPGTTGRAEDQLQLSIKDMSGATLDTPVAIANGATPGRGTFYPFNSDLAYLFDPQRHAGEHFQFRLEVPNPSGQGDSWFHVDQVRLDVCTTTQPPPPESGKVYQVSGRVLVILDGRPTPMAGIDVWAAQLPDGVTPPQELDFRTTQSIQDSSYRFYNLNPGRYRIYAEVWVSGNLYSASTTVEVKVGDVRTDVNLNLL